MRVRLPVLVNIDAAALPFVAIGAVPAVVAGVLGAPLVAAACLIVPVAVALFFRDPDRSTPTARGTVVSPADGVVMHAGPARPAESPAGEWQQITIFLSLLDVHINRAPTSGRVTQVKYVPGSFRAAYRADAHANEHSEVWVDRQGITIVFRQVVGLLARRVVCRVKPGDVLAMGQRVGLMKFGSRMDVFLPVTARVVVRPGMKVRAGETVIAHLVDGEA